MYELRSPNVMVIVVLRPRIDPGSKVLRNKGELNNNYKQPDLRDKIINILQRITNLFCTHHLYFLETQYCSL